MRELIFFVLRRKGRRQHPAYSAYAAAMHEALAARATFVNFSLSVIVVHRGRTAHAYSFALAPSLASASANYALQAHLPTSTFCSHVQLRSLACLQAPVLKHAAALNRSTIHCRHDLQPHFRGVKQAATCFSPRCCPPDL